MRLFSTSAFSLALIAAAGLLVPQVALAKKKEDDKKDEAPKLQASPKFFKGAKEMQDLIAKKDFDGALAKLPEVEATASTPDDHYFVGGFYLSIGSGKQDHALQAKGLQMMVDSGKVDPKMLPRYELELGKLAQMAKDIPAARAHYTKSIDLGETSSEPELMLAETYFSDAYDNVEGNQFSAKGKALAQQGLPYLKKGIEAQKASGQPVPADWYVRGMKMSILSDAPDWLDWSKETLAVQPTAANWHLVLRSVQDKNPNLTRDEDIDVLRLMRANKALSGAYSYGEYTEGAWKLGLPGEVVSVVDEGVASGEVKSTQFTDLYNLAKAAAVKDKATLAASEADAAKASTGKPAANTGNAYLGYGDYAKAIAMYKLALQKGGVDADQVNTRLGIALADSGDLNGARTAFDAVTGATSPVRKSIAQLWEVWLDQKAAPPAAAAAPSAS